MYGAATTTSPCTVQHMMGASSEKKDIFEVSPRHPLDLAEKFARAARFTGPKLFLALSACPIRRDDAIRHIQERVDAYWSGTAT